MYFRDFEIPSIYERFSGEWGGINGIPNGWEEKQPEEVKSKIDQLMGGDFAADKFEHDVKELRKEADNLKSESALLFSILSTTNLSEAEKNLLNGIGTFDFGKSTSQLVNEGLPKTLMTRDIEAIRQGICIAPWLYYESVALEGKTLSESIPRFISVGERLIRSLDKKPAIALDARQKNAELLDSLHPDIYAKCHELYEKEAYPEAVEKSFKIVRDRLRKLTGYETGSEAFGKGRLYIDGAAAANVDQDFNDAVKFLTMAIDRFREREESHV